MANRQEEFLEKLETAIREKWKEEAWFYMRESGLKLEEWVYDNMLKFLKLRRMKSSIFVNIQVRQGRVSVEKSDNDLIVLFDGFQPTKLGKFIIYIFMPFQWMGLTLAFLLFPILWIIDAIKGRPPPKPDIELILLLLLYYGIWIWLTIKGRKILSGKEGIWGRKPRDALNHFLKGSIEETINLFK